MYTTPFHFTQELNTFIIILSLVYLFSACKMLEKNKPRNEFFYSYYSKTHSFIMQSCSSMTDKSTVQKNLCLEYKRADSYSFDAVPPFYTFDKKQVLTAKTCYGRLVMFMGRPYE